MHKFTVRLHVGASWSKDYIVNAVDYQDAAKKAKAHAEQFDRVNPETVWSTQVTSLDEGDDALTCMMEVSY